MNFDMCINRTNWSKIDAVLQSNNHVESFVFGLCRPIAIGKNRLIRFELDDLVFLEDCYEQRSAGGLSLTEDASSALNLLGVMSAKRGAVPVHIHSHPAGISDFSSYDDQHEKALHEWLAQNGQPWLLSIVKAQGCDPRVRLWRDGEAKFCGLRLGLRRITLPNTDRNETNPCEILESLDRQRAFGEEFRQNAARLQIGIVGLGGVGMPVAEMLARSGFTRFVLVDPDRVEATNLNRLGHAYRADIGRQKVNLARSIIRKACAAIGTSPKIRAFPVDICKSGGNAKNALAACDLILALTDDDLSRIMCLKLALENCVEYLQAGIGIFQDRARIAAAKIEVTGAEMGRYCPLCSGRLSPAQASIDARRKVGGDVLAHGLANGYIPEEPAPSIMSMNSICAGAIVFEIQRRIAGLGPDADIWQHDFMTGEDIWTNALEHQLDGECLACGRRKGNDMNEACNP